MKTLLYSFLILTLLLCAQGFCEVRGECSENGHFPHCDARSGCFCEDVGNGCACNCSNFRENNFGQGIVLSNVE